VRDTSRREVLNQLFGGTDIKIRWINPAFADERITGKFSGTPTAVLQKLLAQSNFVIVHAGSGDTSRVARVIIHGPTRREQSSAGLAALAATITPPQQQAAAGAQAQQESLNRRTKSPIPGPVPTPNDLTASTESGGLRTPPPEGLTAPQVVPPTSAEAPPPGDSTALTLMPAPPSVEALGFLLDSSGFPLQDDRGGRLLAM
jgi:hypothetical protein